MTCKKLANSWSEVSSDPLRLLSEVQKVGQLLPGLDTDELEVVIIVGVTCLGRLIPLGSWATTRKGRDGVLEDSWPWALHGCPKAAITAKANCIDNKTSDIKVLSQTPSDESMSLLVPDLALIILLTLKLEPSKRTVIWYPSKFSLLMGDFGNFGSWISRPSEAAISLCLSLQQSGSTFLDRKPSDDIRWVQECHLRRAATRLYIW